MTTASDNGEAHIIFSKLSLEMKAMEDLSADNVTLRDAVEFTKSESARLAQLLESAKRELALTQGEVAELLSSDSLAAPSAALYADIQAGEEANEALRLEIDSSRCLLDSLLREAGDAASQLEALRSSGNPDDDDGDGNDEAAYIARLQASVTAQQTELTKVQFAIEQLEADEATIASQEALILSLREEIESYGLDVPVAPVTQRSNRLQRQRERTAGVHSHATPEFLANHVARGEGQPSTISLIRWGTESCIPSHHGGGGGSSISSSGPTSSAMGAQRGINAAAIVSRSFQIPSGWLRPLTSIIGPLRRLTSEYHLERTCVGTRALEDNVAWQSSSSSGGGGAVSSAAAHPTYLHAFGTQTNLDRFEGILRTALEKVSHTVYRYDGLITYRHSYAAQQQRDTAEKLLSVMHQPLAAVGGAPLRSSHRDAYDVASLHARGSGPSAVVLSLGAGPPRQAAVTPDTGGRRVQVTAADPTPMTIRSVSPRSDTNDPHGLSQHD